jgi:predicted RNase H-like nuclease
MSSVFPVPCREAVYTAKAAEARQINLTVLGRSLTEQTCAISGKIAQLDVLLLEDPSLQSRVREIHPEVCFWALAGRKAMQDKKSRVTGQKERLAVLSRYEKGAAELMALALSQTRRTELRADDVLDAMVEFVTAEARVGPLASLMGQPTHDQRGLPMEMLYLEECIAFR